MPVFQGKIERVFAKEMPEKDKYDNVFRVTIKTEAGDWYSWGNAKRDSINIKDGADWVSVEPGDDVFFKYDVNGDFKNIAKTSMTIVTKGAGGGGESRPAASQAAPAPSAAGNTGGGFKDTSGIETGHAINAAMLLLKDKPKDLEALVVTAQALHDITVAVKAKVKLDNPTLKDYDVGAQSGHAVLNACKLSKKVEEVEAKALELLSAVVAPVQAYVKGEKATPKQAQEPAKEFDAFDDDIPF